MSVLLEHQKRIDSRNSPRPYSMSYVRAHVWQARAWLSLSRNSTSLQLSTWCITRAWLKDLVYRSCYPSSFKTFSETMAHTLAPIGEVWMRPPMYLPFMWICYSLLLDIFQEMQPQRNVWQPCEQRTNLQARLLESEWWSAHPLFVYTGTDYQCPPSSSPNLWPTYCSIGHPKKSDAQRLKISTFPRRWVDRFAAGSFRLSLKAIGYCIEERRSWLVKLDKTLPNLYFGFSLCTSIGAFVGNMAMRHLICQLEIWWQTIWNLTTGRTAKKSHALSIVNIC